MLVDWFTVAAQAVNFLVLVALLKRFLYRPILKAMDEREAKIASRLADAESVKQEAEAERLAHLKERQALMEKRQELLAQAEKEAEVHKQELVRQARQEVAELRARWQESLVREKDMVFQDLRRRLLLQIAAASRQALRELAGIDLEERLLEVFLERLKNLDAGARAEFVESAQEVGGRVTIASGHPVPPETQPRIVQGLKDLAGMDLNPTFETSPLIISGIEVKAGGCKIAWSLGDFLQNLEDAWSEAFAEIPERRPT